MRALTLLPAALLAACAAPAPVARAVAAKPETLWHDMLAPEVQMLLVGLVVGVLLTVFAMAGVILALTSEKGLPRA